jgi:hypothetical protein
MSENIPDKPPEDNQSRSDFGDWRDERRRWREERRAARGGGPSWGVPWVGGAVLIALGIVFLLQNLGLFYLNNWWALFILIPAFGAFASAWRIYQAAGGHLVAPARGSLFGGLVFTLIALIFLFGLNWGLLWPIILILIGAGALLNALLPGRII